MKKSHSSEVFADDRVAVDLERRQFAMALAGALGGVALLEGCAVDSPNGPESFNAISQAANGTTLAWVDTVLGAVPGAAAPPAQRSGDLATKTATDIGATVVIAKGCVTAGDGGGGIFFWSGGTDDGGTFIVPNGGVGSSGEGWSRVWTGQLNIRWFGVPAVFDAAQSTHQPIQLAINAALATPGVPTVYFPPGLYSLSNSVDATSVNLYGENATIAPSGSPGSGPLLRRLYVSGRIEGLNFQGGHVQLEIYGGGANQQQLVVSNCTFLSMDDCAIVVTDYNAMKLVIEHFIFNGPRFFRGALEDLTIRSGFLSWNAPTADASDLRKNYCFAIDYANATLQDLLGAPSASTDDVAWIRINSGQLLCRHVRFGGEQAGNCILHVISAGLMQPLASYVQFEACGMYCAGRYWMKIYDLFPATIRATLLVPGSLDPSLGILVDSTAAASLSQAQYNIVDLDFPWAKLNLASPGSSLNNGPLAPFVERTYEAQSDLPQENLYPSGYFSPAQLGYGLSVAVLATADETFSGRSLPVFQVPSTATSVGRVWTGALALPALVAGTFCYSVYVKCDTTCTVSLTYNGLLVRQFLMTATGGTFQRVYCTFWHDGTSGNSAAIVVDDLRPGSSVSLGFFGLNPGNRPAPYVFPGNPVQPSGANTLPETYYAASAPTTGSFKVGDIAYNTTPAQGGSIGWVFTATGWRPFGPIS